LSIIVGLKSKELDQEKELLTSADPSSETTTKLTAAEQVRQAEQCPQTDVYLETYSKIRSYL
jgi:hypothetical protein